jgi:hypothetical protein
MTRIENTQPVYGASRSDVKMKEYLSDQLIRMYELSQSGRPIKCPRCGETIETRLDPRLGAVRSRQFSCSSCNHSGIHSVRDEVPAKPL